MSFKFDFTLHQNISKAKESAGGKKPGAFLSAFLVNAKTGGKKRLPTHFREFASAMKLFAGQNWSEWARAFAVCVVGL